MISSENLVLTATLSQEQRTLLDTIYSPFGVSGQWPIWQYVDLTLDACGLDATALLFSLPQARGSDGTLWGARYGLTWHSSPTGTLQPDQSVTLTVAGLTHIGAAGSLLDAFLSTLTYLTDRQRSVVPSARKVVEATVTQEEITEWLLSSSIDLQSAPAVDMTMRKLRIVLEHEPILQGSIQEPSDVAQPWILRIPAAVRDLRGTATAPEYVQRIVRWVAPPTPPRLPFPVGALDIAYSVGYLDAVWRGNTGHRLFVNLDPASVARVTQPCTNEVEFNSLLSAIADVLGQLVTPGKATPPQSKALEAFRDYLCPRLEPDAATRVTEAVGLLIKIRHLRVSTQHSDARTHAVTALAALNVEFPIVDWQQAWANVATHAKTSLDAIREEVRAGFQPDSQ